MASSEGLKTVVIEESHLGGQSAFSPLIENVPGFPDAISGPELASMSSRQARKAGGCPLRWILTAVSLDPYKVYSVWILHPERSSYEVFA